MLKRVLVVAMALVAACGPHWIPARPVTVAAAPGAFDKAIALLIAEGESIETKDEAAGTIVTKWIAVSQMGDPIEMRVTITRAGETLIVASQCQRPNIPGPLTTTRMMESCGNVVLETQQAKVDRIAAGLR